MEDELISIGKKSEKRVRTNKDIRVPEVRLIGAEGDQLGVMSTPRALQLAEDEGLDLVEISPTAEPPVCKIMDYGKFKFQQSKKDAKKKQRATQVKIIQMRPRTDIGDYNVKLNKMRDFIERGDKVRIVIRFRGRELAHPEFGRELLDKVQKDMAELCNVEQYPKFEGRQMAMVIAPKPK